LQAFNDAEKEKKPPLRSMFEDMYEEITPTTKAQMKELRDVIERYPNEYDVSEFEGGVQSLS
jgi:2-oxoisovalerate dehydrogenase E1 component alpha subunit